MSLTVPATTWRAPWIGWLLIFLTLKAACREAIVASGQMLQEFHGPEFWNGEDWIMSVTDETGRELFTLRFSGRWNVEQAA